MRISFHFLTHLALPASMVFGEHFEPSAASSHDHAMYGLRHVAKLTVGAGAHKVDVRSRLGAIPLGWGEILHDMVAYSE